MTSPGAPEPPDLLEALAVLAERLEHLEAQQRLQAYATGHQIEDLQDAVASIHDRLADTIAAGADDPAPGEVKPELPPSAWVDYATPADWTGLARWVDWFLTVYDVRDDLTIRPCWPAHLGVAEELAALHAAWRLAAKAERKDVDSNALNTWHDRALHPTLARLRDLYRITNCRDNHARPLDPETTDLHMLTAACHQRATSN